MLGLLITILDFQILDINNTKNIAFLDLSTYSESPQDPILNIVFPASSKYFTVQIQPSKINVFDSNTIGYSQVLNVDSPADLPDGVYNFNYKICPYDFYSTSKCFLRTTILDRNIQRIYEAIDLSQCCEDLNGTKKELIDIHLFLESGKANAILGNSDKASKDYSIAAKKVDKLLQKLNLY